MSLKNNTNENRDWYLIDAKDLPVGRISTLVADLLRGKRKPTYLPNLDGGDHVVVINADKVVLTGHKEDQKRYYRHSGYLGNLRTMTVAEVRRDNPTEILRHSVAGMISNNRLKDGFLSRLHMYVGAEHPHVNIKFKEITQDAIKAVVTK